MGSNYNGTNNTWVAGNKSSTSNQVNWLDSTSNDFYLTGVQLEVGEFTSSTLPPFQRETYGDNLLRCQRYYQILAPDGFSKNIPIVQYQGSYRSLAQVFPTDMRTAPGVTVDTYDGFSAFDGSEISSNSIHAYEGVSYSDTTSMSVRGVRLNAEL